MDNGEVRVFCRSNGRSQKEEAIRKPGVPEPAVLAIYETVGVDVTALPRNRREITEA